MRLGFICLLIVCTNQVRASYANGHFTTDGTKNNLYETVRKLILEGDTNALLPYVRSSVTLQSFHDCIRSFSMLRCTKLFLIRKMQLHHQMRSTGNITRDFINQFLENDHDRETHNSSSLFSQSYENMTDRDLNKRLVENFERFFKNRDIKLYLLPGLLVKVIPSKDNKLKFSLKKKKQSKIFSRGRSMTSDLEASFSSDEPDLDENTKQGLLGGHGHSDEEGTGKRKDKKHTSYKTTMLQMAVPIMVMPAILLGTFLPFWLPVVKMATIMTMIMNNTAFIASLIMAARTYANTRDEAEHISYTHSSYH